MTVRAELDYTRDAWENAQRIAQLVHTEYLTLLPSIRDGHRVEQVLSMPGDDVFFLRNAVNGFMVSAMDLLLRLGQTGDKRANVHESPPIHTQLLSLWSEDIQFRELVIKGDLPSLTRWKKDENKDPAEAGVWSRKHVIGELR